MAYTRKMAGKVPVLKQDLVFDETPTPGSLNPVTSDAVAKIAKSTGDIEDVIPEGASADNKLVDQATLDEATAAWDAGYTPKGPASVSTLNGLSGQENGDRYVLTDGGTLTDGSVIVAAGDEVAWDAAGSKWYKITKATNIYEEQVPGRDDATMNSSWIPVEGNSYVTLVIGSHDVTGVTAGYMVEGIEMRRSSDNVSWLVNHNVKNGTETTRSESKFNSFYVPKGFNAVRAVTRSTNDTSVKITLYKNVTPPNLKFRVSETVKNISHRGVFIGSDIPQNSEVSYSLSIAYGYKYVETDIRETSDGKFVCAHDATYRTLTVATSTLAELSAVPIRSEEIYADYTILTFERLLQIAKKSGLHIYCDMKMVTHISDFCDLVKKYSMGKFVTIIASYTSTLSSYKQYLPNARLGLLASSVSQQNCDDLLALKTSDNEVFIDGNSGSMQTSDYDLAQQNGVPVEEWTSNDTVDSRSVGITTNSQFPPSIVEQAEQSGNIFE